MRFMKIMLVVAVCVLGLGILARAGQNQFGVAATAPFAHPRGSPGAIRRTASKRARAGQLTWCQVKDSSR